MSEKITKSRTPFFITLIAAGVFLVGAALIPLLARGQEIALESSGIIRPPVVMNQAAPKIGLTDLKGNPVSLAEIHGKVVLVNNWATWCPPCQSEMPELEAYYLAHSNQDFVLVAIESGEPADVVGKFIQQYGLTFQVWLDPHGSALDSFQNWDLPSSYLVDALGTLRLSWTGPVNQATLEKYVTPFLEK
jgi:cytochrome c biogenesis protein CcmG/thiol:disulfide interchange protein DsbE